MLNRVRTLTGKEIELDIEPDNKVRAFWAMYQPRRPSRPSHHAFPIRKAMKLTRAQVTRIKERVEEKEGIPPAQQRLIYGGKQM